MRKKVLRILLNTLLIIGLSSLGMAQRATQTGILSGAVVDNQNIPLPGVTVTASSPALMLPQVSVVTDDKGFFRIPQLHTGLYRVVFELSGFKTLIREGIKINIGTTTLTIILDPSPISESVLVIGQSPAVDIKKTAIGINLDLENLRHIPAGRSYTSVMQMAPGVISSGGRPATHGSAVRDNSFNLDGINIGEPGGGVMGSIQIGYEVAEEYQIQTGGHAAEYGTVKGSMINLITKSGGNKFSGEANFYIRDKNLQSDNTAGTPFEGQYVGFNFEYDTTFQLGGPFIKDKVWFFANYSRTYRETIVEGYPYDKDEHVPDDYGKHFPFVKISWQINPAMKLVGNWNWWMALRGNRSASRYRNEDTTWEGDFKSHTFGLAFSYMISKNMIFSSKVAGILVDLEYFAKNDQPSYYDYTTRRYSGSMGNDYLSKRDRFQAYSDLTYFVDDFYGRHEFKTGVEFSYVRRDGGYNYKTDPTLGVTHIYTRDNGLTPYRARKYESYRNINDTSFVGIFLQDRWNPTGRLTFNVGIRFDHQEGIVPKQAEDRAYEPARVLESFKPILWNTISPRIGASYDLTGDGKTVLRASYGRYYSPGISDYFSRVNPNGYERRYYLLNSDGTLGDQYFFSASAATAIDPDVRAPYLDEIIVGVEREVFPEVSLGVNFIKKWDKYLLEDVIAEALNIGAIKDGEYIWQNYNPFTAVDPYTGQIVTFYERDASLTTQSSIITNPEPAKRGYTGIEVLFNKRYSKNWQLMISYTYAKSTGLIGTDSGASAGGSSYFGNPNVHINAIGRFPYERRHQFKLQGTYRAPFGILLSTRYEAFSGLRYARRIRSNDLGLDLYQGDVSIYAEELGSRGLSWIHQWNLRFEKEFKIKDRFTFGLIADVFSVFNLNTTTAVETISSAPNIEFEETTGIMNPRMLRLGIRVRW